MKIIPKQQGTIDHKNITGKEIALAKGSQFSAKVISVAGNSITVELNGKNGKLIVTGLLEGNHTLKENTLLNLEVLGMKEGKNLFSEVTTSKEEKMPQSMSLKDVTISSKELNELTTIFKEKGIPMTKDNLKLIVDQKNFSAKVENLLKGKSIQVGGKEMPKEIKTILLDYFKGHSGDSKTEGNIKTSAEMAMEKNSNSQETIIQEGSKSDVRIGASDTQTSTSTQGFEKQHVGEKMERQENVQDVSKGSLKLPSEEILSKVNDAQNKEGVVKESLGVEKKEVFNREVMSLMSDDVKETLSGANKLESLSMLLKNKMSFTMKNVVLSEKILIGEKEINQQLEEIKSLLPEKVAAGIKSLPVEQLSDSKELNTYYKELISTIEKSVIESNLQNDPKVESKMEMLKNTMSFMDESEGQYNFMQIPIDLNQREANLSIAFKKEEKGKKKVDKDNAVIFIALDTNNLQLVQSKIVVKKKELKVDLRVLDEDVKALFEEYIDSLKTDLEQLEFQNVDLSIVVNQSKKNFFQMLTEEAVNTDVSFDIKV